MEPFQILYEDQSYIAINKPAGILVHKTKMSEDKQFVVQLLRDQTGHKIFPIHRLDRATSGALIFGKSSEAAGALGVCFQDKKVEKKYLAVVRGFAPEKDTIDYALSDPETGKEAQEAITHYERLGSSEMPWAIGLRYQTARFSLLEVELETGRRQQIRKHLAHINHPIIGDRRQGDVKQNNYFQQHFQLQRVLLHAWSLSFKHPDSGEKITLVATLDGEFERMLDLLMLKSYAPLSAYRQ